MTNQKPINVLIVDDEPELRGILAERFRMEGYGAETASTADEALGLLVGEGVGEDGVGQGEDKAFDVIITDIRMPGGSGYDLLDLSKFASVEIPVIMISGDETMEELKSKGMVNGAYCCLRKPIDSNQLFEMVERAVQGVAAPEEPLAA